MTTEQLEQLRELAEKATPGPWHMLWYGRTIKAEKALMPKYADFPKSWNIARIPCRTTDYPIAHEEYEANANFIASANPTVIIELLNQLTEVTKERDNWKSEYENVCKFATDFENQLAEVKAELSRLRPCRGCPTVSCTCMSELEDELLIKISATQKELARAMGRSITLENALKDVFQLIDTEFLIRNTDNDGDPDWAIKMQRPMSILQNAYVAIVGAEPESRSDNGL